MSVYKPDTVDWLRKQNFVREVFNDEMASAFVVLDSWKGSTKSAPGLARLKMGG